MPKSLAKGLMVTAVVVAALIGLAIVSFFIYMVASDLKTEEQLNNIVHDLSLTDKIDMTIQTTGDYATVEKLIKNDYQDFYDLIDKLEQEYGNPVLIGCLSVSNIASDGPTFEKTKADLETLKAAREKINNEMLDIVSDKVVAQKIDDYKLEDYYEELYRDYIADLKVLITELVKADKDFNDLIDVVNEILDFLKTEQNHWKIENNHLIFDDERLLQKYQWLVSKVCADCNQENFNGESQEIEL